jgi:beta-galactosidase
MIRDKTIRKVLYGGDYNPEQWPREIWDEDMRLFGLAGIDTLTINVFSWASLQPSEDEYDFSRLDDIVKAISDAGKFICFATSTATHPAWMARKYPDVLRVNIDGGKRKFGARHNSCPNSPTYRKYSVELARRLAERYGKNPAIKAWHVSNEYGEMCWCDNCQKAFRKWLEKRYGSIGALNEAWNANFWGHTYYDWDDIVAPSHLSEQWNYTRTSCQIQSIDYKRFISDSLLECFKLERDALKSVTPKIPVTTNLMGFYLDLDYHKWAKEMDFVSWDNYPSPNTPPSYVAMTHALMRGCKDGLPFVLMEQTPSVTNWQPYNSLKRPGVMRLWSYQAVAHGSDTILFFQMRRSRGCCEKFHGAIIDHCGNENTRVFRETAALGAELDKIGPAFLGSEVKSRIAIVYDWDNRWGLHYTAGPSVDVNYIDEIFRWYDACASQNYEVDVVGVDTHLEKYDIVVAPLLYMVKRGHADRLKAFVERGGTFITTYFSGIVDERDLVTCGGYPGELREMLGVWVEETDALLPDQANEIVIGKGNSGDAGTQDLSGTYPASILCDIIHPETAEIVGVYGKDFYAGTPAVCRNAFGKGSAWYVGSAVGKSAADGSFCEKLIARCADERGVRPVFPAVTGVEVTRRVNENEYYFVLNHNQESARVTIPFACADLISGSAYSGSEAVDLKPTDVLILERKGKHNT